MVRGGSEGFALCPRGFALGPWGFAGVCVVSAGVRVGSVGVRVGSAEVRVLSAEVRVRSVGVHVESAILCGYQHAGTVYWQGKRPALGGMPYARPTREWVRVLLEYRL